MMITSWTWLSRRPADEIFTNLRLRVQLRDRRAAEVAHRRRAGRRPAGRATRAAGPCTARGPRCLRARASAASRRRPGSSGPSSLPSSRRSSPCRGTPCTSGPGRGSISPGASSVPANSEPIITVSAPAASAFATSPEYLMPPSAMIATPEPFAARDRVARSR